MSVWNDGTTEVDGWRFKKVLNIYKYILVFIIESNLDSSKSWQMYSSLVGDVMLLNRK